MNLNKKNLVSAVNEGIISADQADALYAYLDQQSQNVSKFSFTHVLYYFGGLIAIAAMTIFMTLGWESFGGLGILVVSILYAFAGLSLTHFFSSKKLAIPAGICATFVVCLIPLTIYGLQQWLGFWPDDSVYRDYHQIITANWLYMEIGTLVIGSLLVWKYRYPFLMLPIAFTLWYMSMDIAALISGDYYSWDLRKTVSFYFGLLMIVIAFVLDIKCHRKGDYAFWIYLFGVIAFWGSLSFYSSNNELSKFVYFSINIAMILLGVLLIRKVFVIFGALGSYAYLSYLAFDLFKDSVMFPFTLTIFGLGIIFLGVLWQKHEKRITQKVRLLLPSSLRELLEQKS